MSKCRVCGSEKILETIKAKELFIGTREIYEYLLCCTCGSLSLAHSPQNLDELYAKYPVFDFDLVRISFWKKFLRQQIVLNRNILSRMFLRHLNSWEDLIYKSLHGINLNKSMRILDVGCGNGALIKGLKGIGFTDLTGIDPHLKNPIDNPGFRMLRSNLEDLGEKFDFIMCHHSFEHMEDPYSAVRSFEKLISPGGTLLIRIPNIDSYSFRKFKESWHGIHAPFHFFLPSLAGMKTIFRNTNFELKEVRQEQIVELFLYNINCLLNIGLLEPLGVISCIGGDGDLGKKIPPLFTAQEITFWREKTKVVKQYKKADYIAYYLKNVGN